jgi:hypothetical protein
MNAPYDKNIGFSGHQSLSAETRGAVRTALIQAFSKWGQVLAVTSLAAGSDQIFAECALAAGNDLMVVIPCDRYEGTFANSDDLATYRELLKSSVERIQLSFPAPSEEAYWAAGRRIVDVTDVLVAVWDGLPAGGLGGTADVVHYAENHHKEVLRIWPSGASRG